MKGLWILGISNLLVILIVLVQAEQTTKSVKALLEENAIKGIDKSYTAISDGTSFRMKTNDQEFLNYMYPSETVNFNEPVRLNKNLNSFMPREHQLLKENTMYMASKEEGRGFFGTIFHWCWVLIRELAILIYNLPWKIILEVLGIITVICIILWLIVQIFLFFLMKWRASNYDYNIFDEPGHSKVKYATFASMYFKIPSQFKNFVRSVKSSKQHKGKKYEFTQPNGQTICLILNTK